ncbi:hypothetical protein PGS49_01440 [Yersinia intermedia]|nr:hypothetical protein [Yersinia intermedia]MCW8111147.1 hypothetical protein [Yersinia intermedia]MDA5479329.1 hypothetical protein [Yersinia intermedia]MDA5515795.1 hypothetical protein [Yersinia intermedia]
MPDLYDRPPTSVYQALNDRLKTHVAHRIDHGPPRVMPKPDL